MGRVLIVLGLIFNLIATLFLFSGSKHLLWNSQTWSGETEKEKNFFATRKLHTNIGLLLLFIGFSLQLLGAIQ